MTDGRGTTTLDTREKQVPHPQEPRVRDDKRVGADGVGRRRGRGVPGSFFRQLVGSNSVKENATQQKKTRLSKRKRNTQTFRQDANMKNAKRDGTRIWKQFEDLLVPRLRLSLVDRAVYSHLLRHSRLEGKARLHFSILWLSRGTLMSTGSARGAVRRLAKIGALRLVERSKAGHVV